MVRNSRLEIVRQQEFEHAKRISSLHTQTIEQKNHYEQQMAIYNEYQKKMQEIKALEEQKILILRKVEEQNKDILKEKERINKINEEKIKKQSEWGILTDYLLILVNGEKDRQDKAKQWLEESKKQKKIEEDRIRRLKQVKEQEEHLAKQLAQSYRENNPTLSLQEYQNFSQKKGKKIDIEQFNFINSRIVKHDLQNQQNAVQIAIDEENFQKNQQIIQKKRIKTPQKSVQVQIQSSASKFNSINKQKYAESVFEKAFLTSPIPNEKQRSIERQKELLEKRKMYGKKVKEENKDLSLSKTKKQPKCDEKQDKLKQVKEAQEKLKQRLDKKLPLNDNLKFEGSSQKNQNIQQNYQLKQKFDQVEFELSESSNSEQNYKQPQINNFTQQRQEKLSISSRSSSNNSISLNPINLDHYIYEQQEFLQKLNRKETNLRGDSIQDKILRGEIGGKQKEKENEMMEQFIGGSKVWENQSLDQNYKQFQDETKNLKETQKLSEQKPDLIIKNRQCDQQSILIQKNQKNQPQVQVLTQIQPQQYTIKQNQHDQNDSKQFQNEIFKNDNQIDIVKNKIDLKSQKIDFFENEDEKLSLASRFQQKKLNLSSQQLQKQSRPQKTKEELIEYRKSIMKSQSSREKNHNFQNEAIKPIGFNINLNFNLVEFQEKTQAEQLMERLASGEKSKINKKDMKELTNKNFNLLPEQKKKQEQDEKREQAKQRASKMKEMSDKVRNSLLKR